MTTTQHSRHTAGRYLQALAVGGGPGVGAAAFAEGQGITWVDRGAIVAAARAAVDVVDTDNFPPALQPVADAFVGAMRDFSIPLRLVGLRQIPLRTRVLVNAATGEAVEVAEGQPIPLLNGDWSAHTLEPRKFAAIVAQTNELVRSTSPAASTAITLDLASATAEAENLAFCSPTVAGSVLYGAPHFAATGTTANDITADLGRLFAMVRGRGRGGLSLIMDEVSASHIHFSDPSRFPAIGPGGGRIADVPVLIADAACALPGSPSERVLGLIDATQILFGDRGRVLLDTSREAALQMSDAPVAGAASVVPLFQVDSVATRAIRESSWYAPPGAGAYMTVAY